MLLAAAAAEGAVAAAVLCAACVLGDWFVGVAEFAGAFEEPFGKGRKVRRFGGFLFLELEWKGTYMALARLCSMNSVLTPMRSQTRSSESWKEALVKKGRPAEDHSRRLVVVSIVFLWFFW